MQIIPLIALRVGRAEQAATVLPGEPVEVPEDEARRLIDRGFARPGEAVAIDTAELIDAIVDAIADLDSESFGKDGKPNVKAIEAVLGRDITAADRDQAWATYQRLAADTADDE
jgi:uncharacterized protein YifE (UPF0438 family)